ncbi:efflux RND transporter permease subunit [Anseongella ginsenosidimutans]|uniref:efflux RND transporter permease subunit n=1 Tax=Anseongella ginsenosidimutans TaxID=496056 RepID=UPI0011C7488E|nr:efflux RND transporter permease subunit [Anseongella ginsenosidimutans]QEC52458.1 efflux RND transporter permease subunit [Anseongella ginsenosidimutans]
MKDGAAKIKIPAFSVIIVFFALCVVGASLVPFLSLQLLPSRTLASATVHCYMPNATPETTELELTTPIEDVLSRIKGIKSMNSLSWSGTSYVNMALDKWTDPEMFRFEAATLLRQLTDKLPENASYPTIYLNRPAENSGSNRAILQYSINGPGSVAEIAARVEESFRPALSSIDGIYDISISGARPRRLEVICRDAVMRQLGIGRNEIAGSLQRALSTAHIGTAAWDETGGRSNIIIKQTEMTPAELLELPVTIKGKRIFRLSELAEVEVVPTPASSYYRINGQNRVSLGIYPEEHVNTLVLAGQIKEEITRIGSTLPPGYRVAEQYDATEFIKEELSKIYLRTGLSVVVLLVFVFILARRVRYLLIIIAGLAANVLLSFIFYYFLGLEIHLYSMAGVTISLGLIIDNMIVIVDDIRHTGKNRIFAAILASTLTALGALSVIFFLEEQQQANLLDFAIAIMISLLVSLPVAYLLIPALLEKFPVPVRRNRVYFKRKRGSVRFSRWYRRQIAFMARFRLAFIFFFVLLFGLPVFLLPEEIEKETIWAKLYNKTLGSDTYSQHIRPVVNKIFGGTLRLFVEGGKGALTMAMTMSSEPPCT